MIGLGSGRAKTAIVGMMEMRASWNSTHCTSELVLYLRDNKRLLGVDTYSVTLVDC